MMALAIHWQGLLRVGTAVDQAALARLIGVTRARVTQVMDLLRLAPDLQERLLFLPATLAGRDTIRHDGLFSVAAEPVWTEQRRAVEPERHAGGSLLSAAILVIPLA
jgi:hypothetical protein